MQAFLKRQALSPRVGQFAHEVVSLLQEHGWRPQMKLQSAEAVLKDCATYTYVIYPKQGGRGFIFSFMNKYRFVEHHPLTLISEKRSLWRNGGPRHIGSLSKVIFDMLGGREGQPLL